MRAAAVGELAGRLRGEPFVRLWQNAPLAPFTAFGSGGRADLLVTVESPEALSTLLRLLQERDLDYALLGAGSNLLVADGGYRGVVVKLGEAFSWVEFPRSPEEPLGAGAAVPLPRLATAAAERGWAGLEFAGAIPGTVGGGAAMNAGAHGSCLADVAVALELTDGEGIRWTEAAVLDWEYRRCRLPRHAVVTGVRLALAPEDGGEILERQRSLQRHRRRTQPRGVRTFGSAFRNPPGDFAGRLLDEAGMKGTRRGDAEVSRTHANFVANVGTASTADALVLMGMMREAVRGRSGVLLDPEVRLLGGAFPWEEGTA